MSLPRLWACLAVLLPVLAALVAGLPSVDLAYHIRAGELILDGGGIPTADTFTFTAAGMPWADQQWGAQVLLAAVYRLAGWAGLSIFRAGLVGLLIGLVYAACRLQGADERRAALLSIAAFIVSAVALSLRPQLFGMVLFALVLVVIAARRNWPMALWAVPFIIIAWANLHGSFVLGPVVLGLAWLEDVHDRAPTRNRTLLVGVIAAVATLANPLGWEVWRYAIAVSTNPAVTVRISEWQPTSLRTAGGLLFFSSAAAIAGTLARRHQSTAWPSLAWLTVFFVVGAYAERGVAWWPLVAAFVMAGILRSADRRPPTRSGARVNASFVAVLLVAALAALPFWRPTIPALGAPAGVVTIAPVGITETLRRIARPDDRLINPQAWGSWFEFSLPDTPVAIDSRIELFPESVWSDYETVETGGEGWATIVDQWNATIAVVPADNPEFAQRLRDLGWRETFADGDGRILLAPDRP